MEKQAKKIIKDITFQIDMNNLFNLNDFNKQDVINILDRKINKYVDSQELFIFTKQYFIENYNEKGEHLNGK